MSWCTIESDPRVFSELLTRFGVENAEVEEIYSLDSSEQVVDQLEKQSYGLIFLFKYTEAAVAEDASRPVLAHTDCPPDLFFAKQVITNACATQAILSVILNAENIDLGPQLDDFKSFTLGLDPESKGYTIGNSDVIRTAHNAFAPQTSFESDKSSRHEKGDAFHFIAYVPFKGLVYELDGLKQGPILLGAISEGEDWWSVAKPAIEERMMRYSSSEILFSLLKIRPKRSVALDNYIALKEAELEQLENALADSTEESSELKDMLLSEINQLVEQRAQEDEKLQNQKQENNRRRHNYIPFIMALLRALSEKNKLPGMIEDGKRKAEENAARRAVFKQQKK